MPDSPRRSPVAHGFPHLETVRSAITALYRRLSADGVQQFATSLAPVDAAFADADDLHLGAQRVARAMVHHYRLPDARVIVAFRSMEHAGSVELAAGPEYFVELNDRFAPIAGTSGRPCRTRSPMCCCTGWAWSSPAPATTRS